MLELWNDPEVQRFFAHYGLGAMMYCFLSLPYSIYKTLKQQRQVCVDAEDLIAHIAIKQLSQLLSLTLNQDNTMYTKAELLKLINDLEIKADVYSRTDWLAFEATAAKIKELDMILLDMYNAENEVFLQRRLA